MRTRLAKSFVALLLIVSIGGHWAFLQGFAWVSMVIDYSQEGSISTAISKTFDGQHPCRVCKLVKSGKAAESKQEAIKVKTKIDFWMPGAATTLPLADISSISFTSLDPVCFLRSEAPPLPPPRRA